jgi:Protein of unknown function (DUF2934)
MMFIPDVITLSDKKILPYIHFGLSYPEEVLYFSKRITYEDCVYLCKLHGKYPVPIGEELITNREQQVRNMAYYLWKNNGGDSEDNWFEAEKVQFEYEHGQQLMFANSHVKHMPFIPPNIYV